MKIFLQVQDNRVICFGYSRSTENDIEVEVAEDHEVLKNYLIFKWENGQLVKDEAFQQQLIQEKQEQENKPTTEQQLALMQQAIDGIILGV